jgi:hypothetical protein
MVYTPLLSGQPRDPRDQEDKDPHVRSVLSNRREAIVPRRRYRSAATDIKETVL